jgi:class 3 adenylate cyclase/ABC-type transporter MlaC component
MPQGTRKLVAILFSDIVGYTAAMGEDEERAIRAVSASRTLQRELVEKFRGEWIQTVGDGALCVFDSAVEAATCAVEIQRAFRAGDLRLHIGVHVGDVVMRQTGRETEVFGDGVNVASRLQDLAGPGEILVSERVYEDLANHRGLRFENRGERRLKNVRRPIRVFRVMDRGEPARPRLLRRPRLRWIVAAGIAAFGILTSIALLRSPSRTVDEAPAPRHVAAQPSASEKVPIQPEWTAARRKDEMEAPAAAGIRRAPVRSSHAEHERHPAPGTVRRNDSVVPVVIREVEAQKAEPATIETRVREDEALDDQGAPDAPSKQITMLPAEAASPAVPALGPREVVERTIAEVLAALKEAGPSARERVRRIEHIAYARFDFETFSRLVLFRGWPRFSGAQREEFIRLFEVVLAQRYGRNLEVYDHVDVEVLGTVPGGRGDVTVRTRILGRNAEGWSVDYRMRERHGSWWVIDVTIDGVSLVSSYRNQFAPLLEDGGPEDLLAEVRKKVDAGSFISMPRSKGTQAFEAVRRALLDTSGPWQDARARLRIEPYPVESDQPYQVAFEAECECVAVLFSVHGSSETITLLYPRPPDTGGSLAPGVPLRVQAQASRALRELGGYGMDTLKLFVIDRSLELPFAAGDDWAATPDSPGRVGELRSFLESLPQQGWDSAVAYVQFIR